MRSVTCIIGDITIRSVIDMIENMRIREVELNAASLYLKSEFVGLDVVIDSIMNDIRIWYVMPELIIRPVIVNLWGMTGTGKTDLVRKLVAFLKMDDRFVDIQMDSPVRGDSEYGKCKSVNEALEQSGIDSNNNNIILLDEFQRAKTVSSTGDTIERELFSDVWMLLSDGKFVKAANGGRSYIDRLKLEVDDYFMIMKFERENKTKDKKSRMHMRFSELECCENDISETEDVYVPKIKHSSWYIASLKTKLKLKKSEFELIQMDDFELNTYIKDHIDKNEQIILQGADYSKSLIFVCGNLDNAYSMARSVSDADSDADILHEYSKRISIIDIKQCLGLMFKPEQIARLGNSHIIYPCLNRENYTELIYRNLDLYLNKIAEKSGVAISYSDKLVEKLYANYVYPSQGVRPLYSSICSFISNVLPIFLLDAICNKYESIEIDVIGVLNDVISCTFPDGKVIERRYDFELDNIKKYIDDDKLMLFSVHESAHALVYAELFGYAPKLINVELTSHDGAYILPNEMIATKQVIMDMVTVYLAGAVSERLFFGEMNLSSGCSNDIKQATQQVTLMLRQYGMLDDMVKIDSPNSDCAGFVNTDIDGTNDNVTEIMNKCRDRAESILKNSMKPLKHIITNVYAEKKVSGSAFVELTKDYYPRLKHIDPLDDLGRHEISPDYKKLFEEKTRHI